jgi:HPt (histidine-containing phosphotransfer) domain-containing protein
MAAKSAWSQSKYVDSALSKLDRDLELVASVVDVILAQWPVEEAQLKKALAAGDFAAAAHVLHTLSGSVAYFSSHLSGEMQNVIMQAKSGALTPGKIEPLIAELEELLRELEKWRRIKPA